MLWDGKSAGSVANILELLKKDKKVVAYYAPGKQFHNLCSIEDVEPLCQKCEPDTFDTISRKVRLSSSLRDMRNGRHTMFQPL